MLLLLLLSVSSVPMFGMLKPYKSSLKTSDLYKSRDTVATAVSNQDLHKSVHSSSLPLTELTSTETQESLISSRAVTPSFDSHFDLPGRPLSPYPEDLTLSDESSPADPSPEDPFEQVNFLPNQDYVKLSPGSSKTRHESPYSKDQINAFAKTHNPFATSPKLVPLQPGQEKTMIIELQNTFVSCNQDVSTFRGRHEFVAFPEHGPTLYCQRRPGASRFIKQAVNLNYDVVIWDSEFDMKTIYKILEYLDPSAELITHIIPSSACQYLRNVNGCVKNLQMVGRDLSKTITVDWNDDSFVLQPENALKISRWTEGYEFSELSDSLPKMLLDLETVDDVRTLIRDRYFA